LASASGTPLSVSQARSLLAGGFQALEARKQEVNDLNVYPVPDGDTGTNLALTVRSVVEAVGRMPEGLSAHELCAEVTQAALMGARGNSGVILSQIIRGAMDVVGEAAYVDEATVVRMLQEAADTAYRAVRRPVEGTILTVLREMAEAAARASEGVGLKALLDEVVAAGWKSVERTPTLLRVLAEAGVVDAGGYGLVVLVEGAVKGTGEWQVPIAGRLEPSASVAPPSDASFEEEEESEFTYCCSFLLTGDGLDIPALESEFGGVGDSLLVVGGGTQFKVHVHSDEPGRVLGLATAKGVLSEIEIDNMKEQTAARTRRLEEAGGIAPAESAQGAATEVVAVVAGEGNKQLFRSLGVELLVDGGQSMNPSAEDLLRAIEASKAASVILLPNNGNVIMTAEQTIALTKRDVSVVPSRSIQAGLSAAVVYDRRAPGDENVKEMNEALQRAVTGEVTRAVREALVDGVKVKADDYIGLVDDKVIFAGSTVEEVVEQVVGRLLDGDREVLTALLGEGEMGESARAAVEQMRERYPKVEIDVHEGGQPFYPVLLAAE
jgi:DAK2 domain fusion protein YloV